MPHPDRPSGITRLSRAVAKSALEDAGDGQLLGWFLAERDEAAFAELVRRLGPMVLGVCRRVVGDAHLAEDAFQAAFVVLARRAADVRPREAVRGWLYGVAVRCANKARVMSTRRRGREVPTPVVPDQAAKATEAPDAETLRILDEEVAALPEYMRAAVVLCELDGVTRKDAAARLGVATGTLSSRLARAHQRLGDRLRKRGVTLPAAGLAFALSHGVSAAVPADLVARALAAGFAGPASASVSALVHGVLRTMFLQKLKIVVPVAGLLAAVAFAGVALATAAAKPTAPAVGKPGASVPAAPRQAPQPKAAPTGPNKILIYKAGKLTLIDPDGKNEKQLREDDDELRNVTARLSPDGKRLALMIPRVGLYVRGLDEKGPGTDLGVSPMSFSWSPDGSEIYYRYFRYPPDQKPGPGVIPEVIQGTVNVKTKEKTILKLPSNHIVSDWSRDGKLFLTSSQEGGGTPEKPSSYRLYLMNRDGTEHKALTDGKKSAMGGRLSPDGRQVLFMEFYDSNGEQVRRLSVLDIATGKVTPVEDVPSNGQLLGHCWSPDGKQIAYVWWEVGPMEKRPNEETESHLIVCDPDGKNAKTIVSEKGQGWRWGNGNSGNVDWR